MAFPFEYASEIEEESRHAARQREIEQYGEPTPEQREAITRDLRQRHADPDADEHYQAAYGELAPAVGQGLATLLADLVTEE